MTPTNAPARVAPLTAKRESSPVDVAERSTTSPRDIQPRIHQAASQEPPRFASAAFRLRRLGIARRRRARRLSGWCVSGARRSKPAARLARGGFDRRYQLPADRGQSAGDAGGEAAGLFGASDYPAPVRSE